MALTFLGIGAQKSGTTWLYERLREHPDLAFPLGKEVHFWNAHQQRGLAWYRAAFDQAKPQSGEITPAYGFLPPATVAQIGREFPGLRLFFIMRNPIDRAWSSALMALGRAEMEFSEASDAWFIDHVHSHGSLRRGDYQSCIKTWRAVYPAEQLQLLFYDDIRANPRRLLAACAGHLGVAAGFFDGVADADVSRPVFVGTRAPIRPAVRARLVALYGAKIRALEDYLEVPLGHWLSAHGG